MPYSADYEGRPLVGGPWSGHHLVVGRGLAGTLTRTWSRVLASVDRRQEGGIGGTKFSGAPPRRSIIS